MICGTHLARCACVLGLACAFGAAFAQAPLPPPRPSDLGGATGAPSRLAPAPKSSLAPRSGTAPSPQVDQLPPIDPDHPPVLPSASRARMRECGKEWEAMKMAGKDEIGWRAFATGCLTR
jgi:hypothetical protein